jgi:uncharacterized membrane protein YfcA
MLLLALIGGFAGSYFGAKKMNSGFLNKILAVVLIIAAVKLVLT